MNTFWKDAFAITAGAFFGAILAHAMGHFWAGGLLFGGAIGYFARLITEPLRILEALRQAYQDVYHWRPKKEWKTCFREGSLYGIGAGGVLGMFGFGPFSLYRGYEQGASLEQLIYSYYFTVAVSEILAPIFGAIFAYQEYLYLDEDASKMAKHFNAVSLHYYVLKGAGYSIFYLVAAICKIPRFLRLFAIFVHSENFTACAVYALMAGSIVFLLVPYNPPLMLAVSSLAGLFGAWVRPKALAMLEPALSSP
ncbi:hypothetical protein A3I27_02920 [Candidatus Giovannonibacteria bacterium RIFCSPLOWO2_02_FULL_43_11b]|uniref:Uncharacterized protein n=1 Tax=Candidatus Giovannonibacteria bacterium RIFCSPHIGHO2_12_FULL_43_15 TaxID=1798341 RepID=A0A1F5WR63_9BACT|nr:MAG: hypothetical protein A3B97_01115 [Candidatus Giovannonibacteria bacterium RIFCSPHIGHO2_02_FULL_43_32]OGF78094.1 MAG: hypothetical protein A3F23_02730 [Candidatus Giovannonibacteria bacterium RIFCSPHIGHO2_12_FULL_43_15]OGF89161.1 MAG: hypothetical protein A3I27_02920 [Candidatus Giovannonibacteria bacterium RIFCSPLOWO2_02_FULL_43_11b]OGF92347.1 MAG: hypothetical protein A3H04_01280 [Candidatus Giovannonibacteria bacterium RIFCSPLOWO2_12_FULL_43_11c]